MAYIKELKIPKKNVKNLYQTNFHNGLNNITSSFELNSHSSPDLMNVLVEDGIIKSRPGLKKYISTLLSQEFSRIYVYQKSLTSNKLLILMNDTKVYKLDTVTGTETLILTTTGRACGFQYRNKFYFICPEGYFEYDGTSLTKILPQGSFEVAFATAGAATTVTIEDGNASDDYYNDWYIYIAVGTGVDQVRKVIDYDGATKVATISTGSTDWDTNPDTTSYLYITEHEPGELTTGNDGTYDTKRYTPSYTDYINLNYGENKIDYLYDCSEFTIHRNSFYASVSSTETEKNRVRFNKLDNIYYFGDSAFLEANSGDDDKVIGCFSFNEVLTVFMEKYIFAIYGLDPTDYEIKPVTVSTGTPSFDTVHKVDNYLYYFGSNGIIYSLYDLKTDYRKLLTKDMSSTTIRLANDPINIYETDYSDSRAIFFDNKYILAISDKMLIYDKDYESWTVWDSIEPTAMANLDNILILTNANKYVYRLPFERYFLTQSYTGTAVGGITADETFTVDYGYIGDTEDSSTETVVKVNDVVKTFQKIDNSTFEVTETYSAGSTVKIEYLSMLGDGDDGTAYTSYWKSKDYDLKYPTRTKRIREFTILAQTYKYWSSSMDVKVYIDFDEFDTNFTMDNQIPLFGTAVFGDTFINTNIVQSEDIKINKRGKIISFKVSNSNLNEPWLLFGIYSEITILNN